MEWTVKKHWVKKLPQQVRSAERGMKEVAQQGMELALNAEQGLELALDAKQGMEAALDAE
jgi:hypothetical protein